jgi:hypothetical protein
MVDMVFQTVEGDLVNLNRLLNNDIGSIMQGLYIR